MAPNSVISTWSLNVICCWSVNCCCFNKIGEDIIDGRKRCRRIELWILLVLLSFGCIRNDWVDEHRRWFVVEEDISLRECWRPGESRIGRNGDWRWLFKI